jgi:two-component system cell cycle sensor histidine kinase/response regulator CckA
VIDTFVTDDPRRADLDEIRKAAESATELTRQLLALGRRGVSKSRNLSLEAAVVQTEKMLKRVIGANIRLVTQLADPPNTVWIDPLQLEQIIVNLAVNARDAMPEGGELGITTRTVERTDEEAHLSGRPQGGAVAVLSVRDTGTGMDEHTRARIFEPFFTTKDRSRGTGLGLSIVYSMVEQSGGAIRLFTAPGQGTTFEIDLPISAGAPAPQPVKTETALPRGTEAILLVEDSAPVRVAVCSILMKLGYEVHDFVGAIEALAYIAQGGAPDLLLTDLMLEGANGRDLADQIVARRPRCRVLFMSGYADDPTRKARPLSPEIPVLTKPFSADVLARAVRDALGVGAGSADGHPTAVT